MGKKKPKVKKWKPLTIGRLLAKWDARAEQHFNHSRSIRRKDRRAGGKAMLSKKR